MELLLTILSVLAVWALLSVLVAGLLLIFKGIEQVRIHLQQIAYGVRAIERQTEPFGEHVRELRPALTNASQAMEQVAGRFGDVNRQLAGADSAQPGS